MSPRKPTIGLRTTRANEMWHIDTTVIRLLDRIRAYLRAVIDNFSRRILAWRVVDTCAPINTATERLDASRASAPRGSRIHHQAATGSWTRSLQWETQRTWLSSAGATVCPRPKAIGVWPSNDAWLRAEL